MLGGFRTRVQVTGSGSFSKFISLRAGVFGVSGGSSAATWTTDYPAHTAAQIAAQAARQANDGARDGLEGSIRPLVRRLQASPDVDDSERAAMGITLPDREGTRVDSQPQQVDRVPFIQTRVELMLLLGLGQLLEQVILALGRFVPLIALSLLPRRTQGWWRLQDQPPREGKRSAQRTVRALPHAGCSECNPGGVVEKVVAEHGGPSL